MEHSAMGEVWQHLSAGLPRSVRQRNGQLMGHPLSFPFLNLSNYAAYHQSWEMEMGKELEIVTGPPPARFNGDDIGFPTNNSHYSMWCTVTARYGFFRSLGKNFLSYDWIQLNSTLFVLRNGEFSQVGFANFGHINGRGKGRDEKEGFCTYDVNLITRSESFQPGNALAVLKEFNEHFEATNRREYDWIIKGDSVCNQTNYAKLMGSLPDLLDEQVRGAPPRVRETIGLLFWNHWSQLRAGLPFLPWKQLFRSVMNTDTYRFRFARSFFRAFRISTTDTVDVDLSVSSLWSYDLPKSEVRAREEIKAALKYYKKNIASFSEDRWPLVEFLWQFEPVEKREVVYERPKYEWASFVRAPGEVAL